MNEANHGALHLLLVVLAAVLFLIGAFAWPVPFEPWRTKFISAGLFFWVLSTFF